MRTGSSLHFLSAELTWIGRMDSSKALEAFGEMMREGHERKPLEKRCSAKRDGKLR